MSILILTGEGVSLSADDILRKINGDVDIVKNIVKDDAEVAIFSCGEDLSKAIPWSDQIWQVGSCGTYEDINPDVVYDEVGDFATDIAHDLDGKYSSEVEVEELNSLD